MLLFKQHFQRTDSAHEPSNSTATAADEAADEAVIVHAIPVIITTATGETVEVDFMLRDSLDLRSQVASFCHRYTLVAHTCASLMTRAAAIFSTYQQFITLLNQEAVSASESSTPTETEKEIVPLPDASAASELSAVLPEHAAGGGQSVAAVAATSAAADTDTGTTVGTTATTNSDASSAASASSNQQVLELLAWGLSADLLAVGRGGPYLSPPPLPPPAAASAAVSTSSAASTKKEVTSQTSTEQLQREENDPVAWANFALSDEYFALVASRHAAV